MKWITSIIKYFYKKKELSTKDKLRILLDNYSFIDKLYVNNWDSIEFYSFKKNIIIYTYTEVSLTKHISEPKHLDHKLVKITLGEFFSKDGVYLCESKQLELFLIASLSLIEKYEFSISKNNHNVYGVKSVYEEILDIINMFYLIYRN